MDADAKQQIAAALDEAFGIVAGDSVTLVDPDGEQYDVPAMIEDYTTGISREGVAIDEAGLRPQGTVKITMLKSDLAAVDALLDVTWYFLIDSERWDFAKDEMLGEHIVPIAGIHNQIECIVRRAVEPNSSAEVTEFTYEP